MARRLIVPRDYPRICEALEHADSGDTILLMEGVYAEDVEIRYKNIMLVGHPKATIKGRIKVVLGAVRIANLTIEPRGKDINGVEVKSSPITEIERCNIRNANYGVIVDRSHVEIKYTVIENNNSGIRIRNQSSAVIEKNTLRKNRSSGIYLAYSSAVISENIIQENEGSGIFVALRSIAIIRKNTISKNIGNGISITEDSTVTIYDNEITRNSKGVDVTLRSIVSGIDNEIRDNRVAKTDMDITSISPWRVRRSLI